MDRGLRRRCLAVIRSLEVPDPWDLREFLAGLERQRGRALVLMPPMASSPGAPCGMCITTADTDYVFTVGSATPLHRDHIALHEIGHLLFEHQSALEQDRLADVTALLLPDLSSDLIRSMLGRTAYEAVEEQEAEYFATALLQQVGRRRPLTAPVDPAVADVVERLDGTWGRPDRPSWT